MFKALQRGADRLQTWWTLWVLVGGTGAVTAAMARASAWLAPWGPIGWWAAFLIGCLFAVAVFAGFSWAYGRWMRDRELRKIVARTGINPMADRFEDRTISIIDFYNRDYVPHEDKSFKNCYISGPAMVLLRGGTISGAQFVHCQIVVLKAVPDLQLYGAIALENCHIVGGVMSNLTFVMTKAFYQSLPQDMRANIKVISRSEDE
jgi:hypothetical protein